MKILDHQQVIYCNVVDYQQEMIQYLPGLKFQNKLFVKDKNFSLDQKQEAQSYVKQQFLQSKGQKQYLLLEDKTGLLVWCQDDNVQLLQDFRKNNLLETINLEELAKQIRGKNGIEIKERRHRLKIYPQCFIGSELVDWLAKTLLITPAKAVQLGQKLIDEKWIHHVHDQHNFKNEHLFYRFYSDEKNL